MRVDTFEQAVEAALDWARPRWRSGTLHALDSGQEDDWYFRVVLGAREHLVDGDPLYAQGEEPVILVDKATGRVLETDFPSAEPFLALMRPCGLGEIHDEAGAERARERHRKLVAARLARRRRQKGK